MGWTDILRGQRMRAAPVQKIIKVLRGDLTSADFTPEPIMLTALSSANPNLTLKNLQTGGPTLSIQDPAGVQHLRVNQYGLYTPKVIKVGSNDTIAASENTENLVHIHQNYTGAYTPGTLPGGIIDPLAVEYTVNPSGAFDFGSILGVARTQSGVGAASMRALAAQVIRSGLTHAPADVEAVEAGIQNATLIVSKADNPGAFGAVYGTTGFWANSIGGTIEGGNPGLRNNTAFLATGGGGWQQFFLAWNETLTAKMFEVDKSGIVTLNGALVMSGNGQKFIGGYHDATVINRPFFQASAANQATYVGAIPNGTSTQSAMQALNNATATNAEFISLRADATLMSLRSDRFGSGTYRDLAFTTSDIEALRIRAADRLLDFAAGSTALGGGAAPTLGSIGGSGPTAAGQAAWLKIFVAGTARFIPVWS